MDQGKRVFWIVALAVVTLLAGRKMAGDDESSSNQQPGATTPVLVELFTSQGCSSCPPADRLLGKLAKAGTAGGATVIPLSFHVDYWNYIGWTDPFSSAEWSHRQSSYAESFGSSRVYTPQVVVNGRRDCVGSNEKRVREEIDRAAREGNAGRLKIERIASRDTRILNLFIEADVDGNRLEGIDAGSRWSVMVAVFETDLETPVSRGENGGRTLRNSHVVRTLTEAFSLPSRPGARHSEELRIELEDAWNREHLGVAVFLQDPETRHIHGAAVSYLSA